MFCFYPFRQQLTRPYAWAWGSHEHKVGVLVSLQAPDGDICGWGEVAPTPNSTFSLTTVTDELRSLTHLLDPFSRDFFDELDRRKPASRYRNALASAVLSGLAQMENIPLARLLSHDGRFQPEVKVNGFLEAVTPAEAVKRAAQFTSEGIDVVKLKCTNDVEADYARVEALACNFPSLRYRLDPNGCWGALDCFATFEKFARFPIEYVEEPVPVSGNLQLLKELRRILPIGLDHWGSTVEELDLLVESEALDFLILKSQVLGGPDKTVAVAQHAARLNIPCVVTASLETLIGITCALHCAAALPSDRLSHGLYLWDFLHPPLFEHPVVDNGRIRVPEFPGLGFKPKLENVALS